ncbi:replication associated protein [Peromfec virus RodF5_43]|uniref:Replication-associated protein n=1 Tax=Peromfec virus RodF5_43 TaxID=2929286 RepID=A0A976N2T3_9CIRC|nr:replication associated protein [Peromfec virus RodF5_43]
MNNTLRRFTFTLFNYTPEDEAKIKEFIISHCKYGVFGKELCPETKKPHLQGFGNLVKPTKFKTVKASIHPSVHLEQAKGTDEENREYCTKDGDFFEHGQPSRAGARTDMQSLCDCIIAGETSYDTLCRSFGPLVCRYSRGVRDFIRTIHCPPHRNFKTNVHYFYGLPGVGKSRTAREEAEQAGGEIFYKSRGEWWDGYFNQPNVIIDDFYGWIKYDELLKICDRYPYQVPVKGGFERFVAKNIWITSERSIEDLYHFTMYNPESIRRRCTTIRHFPKN